MIDSRGKFYIGRLVDSASGEVQPSPHFYDPDDLTTHGVVVGMTGSGKTGLCLDILEEAALNNVPALMIDPKGDITNALLHFPDLAPVDFEPWINADEARRSGKSVAEAAADTAKMWREGLESWDIGPERIQRLKDSVQFSVYTPGSDAGLTVSILASLNAPEIDWEGNKELLREKIAGTVTALLGLVGLKDIDPLRSREHILLANIFENAWSQGKDLTLAELIMQVQNPPFARLGVFEVATFYPDKDRFGLAMDLNSILAAPSFQPWIEGEPLNVRNLLFTADGRPRHTIFYIAHLEDAERMFFVTLLYSAVETWMRQQSGTSSLRALVYFDEITGYLPPVSNPPSKEPMLRLLKQARAFGVGMLLATQNPVDVDYKALSNAGTWFIGKLGTDQDKQRLLDGLSSAMGAGLDRAEYDRLISALGKRVFLMRNVHDKQPTIFQTRWAMNYLAGPLTRTHIPTLNALAGVGSAVGTTLPASGSQIADTKPLADTASAAAVAAETSPDVSPEKVLELPGSETRPPTSSRMGEYFLAPGVALAQAAQERGIQVGASGQLGVLYRPVLLAQADVRFTNRKYNLNVDVVRSALVEHPDDRGMVRWQDYLIEPLADGQFDRVPLRDARFVRLEGALNDDTVLRSLKSDLEEWIYREVQVKVKANEELSVYAGPDVNEETFQRQCQEAAAVREAEEIEKERKRVETQIERVEKRLRDEERELREDEDELAARKREELTKHAETVFGFLTGKRRSVSSSMTKRRMTERAKADVEESEAAIKEFQRELEALREDLTRTVSEIEDLWDEIAAEVTQIPVSPYKKDILVTLFGIGWLPHYLVEDRGKLRELPAVAWESPPGG